MTTEMIEKEMPVVMNITSYSNIAQKMNFLAQGIKNQEDAEHQDVYIECYTDTRDGADIKVVRLSTDLYLWTEVHPVDKHEGDILPKSISVNLYDFYNIIDNCKDDLISMWIDDENDELVINSFYNENREYDELEVRMQIHNSSFLMRELPPVSGDPLYSFQLDNIALHILIHEMNTENKTEGINVIIQDRKIYFQSDYNGLMTTLKIKDHEKQAFIKDFTAFIPIYVFNLMTATGQIEEIKFDIYDKHICVNTEHYGFAYNIEKQPSIEKIDANTDDYFVADPENILASIQLLNRVNKPAKISIAKIEKVDALTADFTVECESRFTASARIDLAMLSDKVVYVDSDILESIFTKTNIDGIKVKTTEDGNVLIEYENKLFEKTIFYDHKKFMEYRASLLEEIK